MSSSRWSIMRRPLRMAIARISMMSSTLSRTAKTQLTSLSAWSSRTRVTNGSWTTSMIRILKTSSNSIHMTSQTLSMSTDTSMMSSMTPTILNPCIKITRHRLTVTVLRLSISGLTRTKSRIWSPSISSLTLILAMNTR